MADEPRRSGRATKGQHKPLDDSEVAPKSKKGVNAKASKKSTKPVEEAVEEEAEEVIRCVCGDNSDDEEGRKFISCDACEVWQHNVCMGVPLEDDKQPVHYFCEQCRPEEHEKLLDAMARGEKLWEERQQEITQKGKKKGGKRGRKPGRASKAADSKPEAEEEKETPANSQDSGTKRKFEEETEQTSTEKTNGHAEEPNDTPSDTRADKRRKPSAKDIPSKDPATALLDISLLPKERQNVGVALRTLVADGIRNRVRSQTYRIPDGETADSLANRVAKLVEYELHMVHGETMKAYGTQFRAINANLKKNAALLDRLLNKSLSPAELAVMSSQDMASEELQREREKMKEEADKQAVMMQDDGKPRVRRTHKGDEYVDDSTTNNAESVFTSQPVRRRESELDLDGAGSPTQPSAAAASPRADTQPSPATDGRRASLSAGRRQSSQNFDINSVWAKTAASPTSDQQSFRPPLPPQNGTSRTELQMQDRQTGDADIDRLLADDDADDAYSPADAQPSPSGVIWQGKLLQPGVTQLTTSARFVAGNDFSRYVSWDSLMPSMLEIEGRLERTKADDYMCGLQWSKKSDVSVLQISANDDRAAFDTIFDYFHSRRRYAVGKKGHGCSEIIKDLYISPIDKGEQPPPHLGLLDFCSVTVPLQEKTLLLTVVINKPTSWDQADAMQVPTDQSMPPHLAHAGRMSLPGPAASPIASTGPGFSPAPRQGFTPDAAPGSGNFPPNPYAAAQPPPQQQLAQFSPNAAQILGPYVHAPVAQQILTATQGRVSDGEAGNMRDIFDKEPRARDDMGVFSSVLSG